jgi:Pyruvate/2-oxoacid:ferredoxin oxidoreductase delta subunit
VARLTRAPLLGALMARWLSEGDDLIYLPRDEVIPIQVPIAGPESTVLPSQVVDHFIDQAEDHWVMNFCLCRASEKCQHYPIPLGCLFLGKATLNINPKLGRRVSREEAHEHVKKCREAGLVHLIGRNKLDTVWLGAGPRERLLTICNCCPCCCLWRIIPQVSDEFASKVHRMPGVTVRVTDRCVGCGVCARDVCFVQAIRLVNGLAEISEACRGCGRCAEVCPEHAIEVSVRDERYIGETISRIAERVDLS